MRLIDFDKIPFLAIPIASVVKGESVHYEQGVLKEWFDGTQDVEAVPLDRIKSLREDAVKYRDNEENDFVDFEVGAINGVIALIDKLIAEAEG